MLSSYINVFNTCLVLMQREGYSLSYDKGKDAWLASKNGFSFWGDNPTELLGLTAIYEKLRPAADTEYWWKIATPNLLDELDPHSSADG